MYRKGSGYPRFNTSVNSKRCNCHFPILEVVFFAMNVLTLAITGLSIPLLVCTIFGNFLVGVVINRNKKLQNVNTGLISNLAWSDFGFGVVTFLEILSVSQKFEIRMSSFQFVINGLASVYFLAALAVERYFAILKPFVHMRRAGKSLMWKVLVVIWIAVGVLGTSGIIIEGQASQSASMENARTNVTSRPPPTNITKGSSTLIETLATAYIFVLLAFGFVLPSVVMIFCYSRVIYHVWFNTEDNRTTNHALFKSRRKLTKLFIILTVIFLFTWTPTFGRPIVTRFGNRENATKYELFSLLLALLGSAANPVIYSFRCPRFRQEVVKLLTCCCCKRKRQVNRNRIFVADSFSLKETKKTRAIAEPASLSFRAAGQPYN